MNHLEKLIRQIWLRIFIIFFLANSLLIGLWWAGSRQLGFSAFSILMILVASAIVLSIVAAGLAAKLITEPVSFIWQAILHVSPSENIPAPNVEKAKIGRELVSSLVLQVYQLASNIAEAKDSNVKHEVIGQAATIAHNLPLPVFVMDKSLTVRFVNEAAMQYCQAESSEILGKNLYDVLNLSFGSENTFDAWLKTCREKTVTATQSWERVRLKSGDKPDVKQFDMAASYNKDNPSGVESMIALFDRSERYGSEDQSMNFVALAVHELRTPLTVMRGYIEVFQEELKDKLTPELSDFMRKMQASSEALAGFVNNILNVSRVEENQMALRLNEESWQDVLSSAVENMKLQAQVHKKMLELNIAPNLPLVAADRVGIYEVINNLIDNAIKYSGNEPKKIIIHSGLNQEGLVETTVQDFGIGIPAAVVPNLFDKFYRSHRSRSQIGGTGLGLYLSKAIIRAHGGNIWVRSKEGDGTVFGFTILPYSKLAEELKTNDNKEITRSAHGWIKNHSLYRR